MNDFLLDTNNDLAIKDGDLAIGDCEQQNINALLLAEKGAFKQWPALGVGLLTYLENEDTAGMFSEIRRQLTADGVTIKKMEFLESGKINIDANY